jgi:hypothetical protein
MLIGTSYVSKVVGTTELVEVVGVEKAKTSKVRAPFHQYPLTAKILKNCPEDAVGRLL